MPFGHPLDRISNVHWGGVPFTYVGGQEEIARQPFAQVGRSSDGYKWTKTDNITLGKNAIFVASVSGFILIDNKLRPCICAVGNAVDTRFSVDGIPIASPYPIAAFSFNSGKSWGNSNLPRLESRTGRALAIGYHSTLRSFYAGVLYSPAPDWLLVLYKSGVDGWTETSRISVSINAVDVNGFPLLPYPQKTILNDRLLIQHADELVVQTRNDIVYCSCNGPGQIMRMTDPADPEEEIVINMNKQGTLLINGISTSKTGFSACAGKGSVCLVTFDSGISVIVSSDAGRTWKSTLRFSSAIPGTVAFQ